MINLDDIIIIIIIVITITITIAIIGTITIISTRPKPPYGRQGLAVSWGKDTVRWIHFGVFSASGFAPPALSSNWIYC